MILFYAIYMKKDIKDYIRLLSFLKPHTWVLVAASACMLVYSILNSFSIAGLIPVFDNILGGKKIVIPAGTRTPAFITQLVDKINSFELMNLMIILLAGTLVYFFMRSIFDFLQVYLMNDVSQRVVRDVKDAIYKKLLSLSMHFYSKNSTGKLASRITYDASIVRDAISTGLLDLILRPFELISHFVVVVGIVMFFRIPIKFLITSAILFPLLLLPAALIAKRLRQITTWSQEKVGSINTIIFEIISGIRIVKAFSTQKQEQDRFKAQNEIFYRLSMKSVKRINSISPINEFIGAIYLIVVLYLAGKEIIAGTLSMGPFSAFLVSVLLMMKPAKRLGKVYAIIQQALAASTRIFDILDTETKIKEDENALPLKPFSDRISLEGVWFKYDIEEGYILKNVTLEAKKGDIIAFVGQSGSGKTTLVNLIPRFYDPQKGSLKIDGVDLKRARLKSIRDQIGIVTQDILLFNDTALNNISYGSREYSRDDIVKAAKIANAHDFIMKMPQGYDTVIGERGFRISGGEKQRLAIARAIFKNPPVLILDEATSQLDTESERFVQEAIDRLMKGRTVFVVAHRLSTIKHATRIVVLDNNTIADIGTHDELMDKGGLYKGLYNMQFRV